MYIADRLIGESAENREGAILESIAETDNEEQGDGDDEPSEGVTGPITDDATEDDTVDQGSDDEGHYIKSQFEIFVIKYFSTDDEQSYNEQAVTSETEAIPSGPRKVECPEDDEFLNALDKMVSENIQERIRETVKATNIDIPVPMVLKSSKKTYDQLQVGIRVNVCLISCIFLYYRKRQKKIQLQWDLP